jgi:hypothetical protein
MKFNSDIMAALVSIQYGSFQNLLMLNSVYLTLIPKKQVVEQAKYLRFIYKFNPQLC